MFRNLDWKDKVEIVGYSKSKREIFWNATAFVLIAVAFWLFTLTSKLPSNWHELTPEEAGELSIEFSFFERAVPILLYIISYWLFTKVFIKKDQDPLSGKTILNKVYIMSGIILISSILEIIGIILIL